MKEHPILFKDEMVRAILRKIDPKGATRRIPDCRNAKWQVGDRLWVKEVFNLVPLMTHMIIFRADQIHPQSFKFKSSLFMPRKYSRILLEITAIREEKLQDITEEDARAEGVMPDCPVGYIPAHQAAPYSYCFAQLWESINAKRGYGWDANPTVKVIEFRRVDNE